jgi:hypothetical protein
MTEDEIFYRARSLGLDTKAAAFLSSQLGGDGKLIVDARIKTMLRGVLSRRTKSHARRYVIRNRRAYNHDRARQFQHERTVLRERDGMRCVLCAHIPPQPGEIMEEMQEMEIA